MRNSVKTFYRGSAAAVAVMFSSGALAGGGTAGSLVYGPGSNAVPTLGGTALVALALLLAVVAFRVLRSEQYRGMNLVVAATMATAIAAAGGGVKLISDAQARPDQSMDSAKGGSAPLFDGLNRIDNTSGVTQFVMNIDLDPDCRISGGNGGDNGGAITLFNGGGDDVGECSDSPSTEVPEGSSCSLNISCLEE